MTDVQQNGGDPAPGTSPVTPSPTLPVVNGLHEGKSAEQWYKDYTGSQSAVRAKDSALGDALKEFNRVNAEYQGKITEWGNQKESLEREKKVLSDERALFEKQLKGYQRRDSLRTVIGGKDAEGKPSKYTDLIPAFDAQVLVITDDLEGDKLTAFLDNALNFMKGVQSTSVVDVLAGGSPPSPQGSGQPAGMTKADMEKRLNDLQQIGQVDTKEYLELRSAYFNLKS